MASVNEIVDLPSFLLGGHPGLILKALTPNGKTSPGLDTYHCVLSRSRPWLIPMAIIIVIIITMYSLRHQQNTNLEKTSTLASVPVGRDGWR